MPILQGPAVWPVAKKDSVGNETIYRLQSLEPGYGLGLQVLGDHADDRYYSVQFPSAWTSETSPQGVSTCFYHAGVMMLRQNNSSNRVEFMERRR